MIYFLYGEDSFRSKEKLQEIVEGYKKVHKSGLNLIYVDAKEKTFPDFYSNFKITSMFAEKKLIILSNIFENAKFQEGFLKELENIEKLKDIVIIYESNKPDQRTKVFKDLQKKCLPAGRQAKCQEFKFLQPGMIKKWIFQEVEKNGSKIDGPAADLLANFVKNDLWRLSGEIAKLANYKKAGLITKEDVILQVKPDIENDIFKTIEAIASKNKKQALQLMHKHLDGGEFPLYLLSMINYQFRNLLIIKDLADKRLPYQAIVKKSGLHPFAVQKTFYASNQFTSPQLRKIYQKIFEIDSNIKIGKIEAETALDLLVLEI